MNKKFMAVLLVIVMVVSMVPMTALAADDHTCNMDINVSNGNGKHGVGCSICKTISPNAWLLFPCGDYAEPKDGLCDDCGAAVGHTHAYTILETYNNGTHKKSCSCGESLDFNCDYVDGTCECGYSNVVCQHDKVTYWDDNEDGTHKITCDCGHIIAEAAAHIYEGTSCQCGAIKPADTCTHEDTGIVDRGENHEIWCKDCTWNDFEDHNYSNGVCECGAVNPCTHEWKSVSNQGATHNITCRECPEILETGVAHDFTNGDCPCGATHKCDFDNGVTSNNNGTHNVNCICGKFMQVACLDNDGDGKCDSCGYTKYEAPVELPTYATASTVGLDNVPKTGCAFVEWLYALIFG